MSTTINIILDTRRIKKSSKYPVKLRLTFERKTVYYQTIFDLHKDEYQKLSGSRINSELQIVRDELRALEAAAKTIAKQFELFNFLDFENEFIHNNFLFKKRNIKGQLCTKDKSSFDYDPFLKKFPILQEDLSNAKVDSIIVAYLNFIKKLLRQGRISTAVNYHGSYVSLKKFKGNVRFFDIDVSYLREYENRMINLGISKTTVGFYLRPLRSLFNEAIEKGIVKREKYYPFGKRKYRIPTSRNLKKALDINDIKKIYYYKCDPEKESEQKAKDFWLFSYFANGMNPKDIASLRYKNIHDDYLVFERCKTENALRSDPKLISVFIIDDMKLIMDRWCNMDKSPKNFIFPIFEHGITPLRQYELLQLFVSLINDWMKRILKNLGIDKKATTYVARHSFSTVLKRTGASTEYIQEALGHTDIKTTENYLGSFENAIKKEYANKLISFKVEVERE